jgi:hypothetical protein
MKSFFRFLLLGSLIFLMGCTITKRKYTGGYYVNWHKKAPDTKVITQSKKAEISSSKTTLTSSFSVKTVIAQKTISHINRKLEQYISSKPQEKIPTKSFWNNLLLQPVSTSYTVTPENTIPGHDQPEKDTSKKDITITYIFFLLWVVSFLILTLMLLSGGGFSSLLLPFLLIVVLITSLIISLVHSFHAMKEKKNVGLVLVAILDIAVLVFSLIIIGASIANLGNI